MSEEKSWRFISAAEYAEVLRKIKSQRKRFDIPIRIPFNIFKKEIFEFHFPRKIFLFRIASIRDKIGIQLFNGIVGFRMRQKFYA